MILTTLCYMEQDGQYLMLLRNRKKQDVNEGKWIGVGGKFQKGESPEECIRREISEETGLITDALHLRGVLTFSSEGWEDEIIFVFTCDEFHGTLKSCDEGELRWIRKDELLSLNLWEGDRTFLKLLLEDAGFFSLKLAYQGDRLTEHTLQLY